MLLILAVVATVTSCAQPPRYDEVATTLPPLAPNLARIYAYRGPGVYEGLAWVPILLNGAQSGAVGPGQVIMRDVVPGTYIIGAATQGLYPGQDKVVPLAPGQTVYVKVTTIRGLNPSSTRTQPMNTYVAVIVDPEIGRQEIAGLAFVAAGRAGARPAG
jgi:hypothetical protein